MAAVVDVQHLRKAYGGVLAVDDLSLEVEQGEIFGLLGPNGAGKTTTVECMEGLRHPDEGWIRVLGLDPAREPRELRRQIGCQLQEAALPDRIRVWEALDLFAALAPRGLRGVPFWTPGGWRERGGQPSPASPAANGSGSSSPWRSSTSPRWSSLTS
jgi:ABC-type multidrug transport system ATPase subunit